MSSGSPSSFGGGGVNNVASTSADDDDLACLLAKKERDLELAAKIGQSLLEQNKDLQTKNEFLEESVGRNLETIIQLKHELGQRIDLLRVYSNLDDDGFQRSGSDDSLKARLENSRFENERLKRAVENLQKDSEVSINEERRRAEIVERQLDDANDKVQKLQKQIESKTTELNGQSDTVGRLLKELTERQHREKEICMEKEEMQQVLVEMIQKNDEITMELKEMQEEYTDLKSTFVEAEEELRRLRQSNQNRTASFDSLYDSWASEMETSDSGVCSSRAVKGPVDAQGFLTARSCTSGMGGVQYACQHSNVPLSLEMELAESLSVQPAPNSDGVSFASESASPAHKDDVPAERETLRPPPRQLCDASTSCTDIFDETKKEVDDVDAPVTPLVTPTETPTPKTGRRNMKLEFTRSQTIDCPPSPSTMMANGKRCFLLNRSPKKTLTAAPGTAQPSIVVRSAKRTDSQDSLDGYDAPKLGQPGVPGTRDLDFMLKSIKAREELPSAINGRRRRSLMQAAHDVIACGGLLDATPLLTRLKHRKYSHVVSSAPSSSQFHSHSQSGLPFSIAYPSCSTGESPSLATPPYITMYQSASDVGKTEAVDTLKSAEKRKSSVSGWTDFSAAYGMKIIQSMSSNHGSFDGGLGAIGGRSHGVVTRAEMLGSPNTSPHHRHLSLSLSSAPSTSSAGIISRR